MDESEFQNWTRGLAVWLRALQENMRLASYLVDDVLSGKETEFLEIEKTMMSAVDEVLYHSGRCIVTQLSALFDPGATLTEAQLATVRAYQEEYNTLVTQLTVTIEAVEHVYTLRKLPQ